PAGRGCRGLELTDIDTANAGVHLVELRREIALRKVVLSEREVLAVHARALWRENACGPSERTFELGELGRLEPDEHLVARRLRRRVRVLGEPGTREETVAGGRCDRDEQRGERASSQNGLHGRSCANGSR